MKLKGIQNICLNEIWLGIMTSLTIFMVVSYIIRAVVCSVYIINVTREGFVKIPDVWNYGLELISRFKVDLSG